MPTAGELLREERLRRGRSIAEISEQTCISTRYLEAIETDQLHALPGEFFHRAFIRQYANALQLDPATTAMVLEAAGPTVAPDPVPALNAAYENAQTGADTRPRVATGTLVVFLVAALLGGSGLYAWWQHVQTRRERTAMGQPVRERTRTPAATPVATPASVETDGQTGPSAATVQPDEPPPATVPAQLSLEATERVWISVEGAGERIFSGILRPGDTRSFVVPSPGRMVVGNAGGLTGSYAGKPLGEIGPRGHVRTLNFSDENFEVRQSRPKSQRD
jgi:cytoskeletal protein RodZ